MKTNIRSFLILILALWMGAGIPDSLRAAIRGWDSDPLTSGAQDGSGTWDVALANTNWWSGLVNVTWTNSIPDAAVFGTNNGAAGTVTLATNIRTAGLTFNPAGSGIYTIAGNGFVLTNTGSITVNESATINTPLYLAGAATWTLAPGKTLTINSNAFGSASALTCFGTGTGNFASISNVGGILMFQGGGTWNINGGNIGNPSQFWMGFCTNGQVNVVNYNGANTPLLTASSALLMGRADATQNGTNYFNLQSGSITTAALDLLGQVNGVNYFNISGGAYTNQNAAGTGIAIGNWSTSGFGSNLTTVITISGNGRAVLNGPATATILMPRGGRTSETAVNALGVGASNSMVTSIINLDGGVLMTSRQIFKNGAGVANSLFNFNGGLFQAATNNQPNWISLLNHAYVKPGGAIIDVRNFSMGIPQGLEHWPDGPAIDGGLLKIGSGTLTLSGVNTYTGPTLVTNGTFVLSGSSSGGSAVVVSNGSTFLLSGSLSGGGSVTVHDGSTLNATGTSSDPVNINNGGNATGTGSLGAGTVKHGGVLNPGTAGAGTLFFSSLALGTVAGDRTTNNINAFLGAKINGGAVVLTGTNVINLTGPAPVALGAYDLINYTTISTNGVGRFVLGTLPYGTSGYLFDSGFAIQYIATNYTAQTLDWIGNATGTWNQTNSLDWFGESSLVPEAYHDFLATAFKDGATNFNVTLAGLLTPSSVTVSSSGNHYFRGSGVIAGTTPLTIDGPGTLSVGNSNAYTGGTTINGGTLVLTNGGFISGDITDNSVLAFDRSDNSPVNGTISGFGSVVKRGAGTVTLNGTNTYSGNTAVTAGTLALTVNGATSGGVGTIINDLTVTTNGVVLSQAQDSFGSVGGSMVNIVNLNGGALFHTAGNNLSLFGPAVNMTGGTMSATNTGGRFDLGNGIVINTFSNALPSVIGGNSVSLRQSFNTFTVERGNGPVDLVVTAPISQVPTASITKQGAGIMVLGGNNSYTDGTTISEGTVQVGFGTGTGSLGTGPVNNSGTLIFNRTNTLTAANDIGGAGSLVQAGSGTTILTGGNGYNGSTTVSNGTLQINSSLSGGGPLAVRNGASFVHGPGGAGSFSAFTVDAGATLTYIAGATTDSVSAPGGLTLNGPSTVRISNPLPSTTGAYDLITYNGGINGSGISALSLVMPTPRAIGALITNLAGTAVQLDLISLGQLRWNGNIAGTWDLSGANEWMLLSTNVTATGFTNSDSVLFNDTNATYTVNIATNVQPGAVTVSTTSNYLFTGVGSIAGATTLTHNGPGTLRIGNTNTYTGVTTVNDGLLQVTNNGALSGNVMINNGEFQMANGGSLLAGSVTDNALLSFNRSDVSTFSRSISGSGIVLNKGSGTVTLSAGSSYSGGTIARSGALQFVLANSLGTGEVTMTDANTGSSTASVLGVTVNTGTAGRYTIANPFTVASNNVSQVIIGVTNSAPLVVNSGIFFSGALTLNKSMTYLAQNGEVYVTGAISGNGNITCAGNTRTLLNAPGADGFTGDVFVTDTASLQIFASRLGANRRIDLGAGTALMIQGNAQMGMLTGSGNAARVGGNSGLLTVGNGDGSWTFNGTFLAGTYGGQTLLTTDLGILKTGTGTFTFNGTGDYTSNTIVAAGTMLVNGSLPASSAVIVEAGATLGGSGNIGGFVTNNGTIAPGASVGTLTTGSEIWSPSASYTFEITNAATLGGSDRLNINGTLDIQSNPGTPFTIKVVSLTAANAAGPMGDFNKALSYSWPLAATTGGILNFAPNNFVLDTSGVANDFSGGSFSLAVVGNSLVLNYTGTAPTITSFGPTGPNFYVLFNGKNGDPYRVITTTNLTVPMTNWQTVASGTFSGSPVGYTNIGALDPQRFFRIASP